jgi:hypothetical protein
VELVLEETESDQRIDVQKITHGKVARISLTCLLVKSGASPATLRTAKPVAGSTRIFTFRGRSLRGVSTIRPPSSAASRESPGRSPSW